MLEPRLIPADSPDALALTSAMIAEIQAAYGDTVIDNTPSATPADLSPPGGCFLALYDDGCAVAGGGVKRLTTTIAEIKRMFVVPERRGEGIGRALLEALEGAARDLGYAYARLDTGTEQPNAERLYRSAGYEPIENYNANRFASFWGEKRLGTKRSRSPRGRS